MRLTPSSSLQVLLGNEARKISHASAPSSGVFEFEVPTMTPAELHCELDLCHAFVFKVSHVKGL
jgi:hypothetical protein